MVGLEECGNGGMGVGGVLDLWPFWYLNHPLTLLLVKSRAFIPTF